MLQIYRKQDRSDVSVFAPAGNRKTKSTMFRFLALVLCLCMILPAASGLISLAGITPGTMGHTADGDTMNSYIDALNLLNSSRNAGRVWADKSVFTKGIELSMATSGWNGTIANDSDFLHVFSALGSSQVVNTEEKVPMDVVFILDVSGSMLDFPRAENGAYLKDQMRIRLIMNAVSQAIDTINSLGDYNRVAIALYADKSAVYLPLVNLVSCYDVGNHKHNKSYNCSKGKWFCEEENSTTNFTFYMQCDKVRRAISADKWTEELTPEQAGVEQLAFGYADGTTYRGGYRLGTATNMQAGIAAGMGILAEEPVTKWTSPESGITYDRIPVVMVMTDGGCNTICVSNDGDNANSWYNTKFYDGEINSTSGGVKLNDTIGSDYEPAYITGSVVPTLLTAAYNMARIKKNYNAAPHAFGVSVDNPGTVQDRKINATLNPSDETLKAAYNEEYNPSSTMITAYDYIEEWKKASTDAIYSGILPMKGNPAEAPKYNDIYISQLPEDSVITKKEVIDNLYFIEKDSDGNNTGFYDVSRDDVSGVFSDIITSVSYQNSVFTPVGGWNDLNFADALTYMDLIGKYMEVKSVKNVLLFGQLYTVVKSGTELYFDANGNPANANNYAYSIQYYTIDNDAEITNPCYGTNDVKFNLSDIVIYVKTTGDYRDPDIDDNDGIQSDAGGDQALYISIPVSALPMQVVTITLDKTGGVEKYETNLEDKAQSTPLRVFYSVGMSDKVLTEDKNDVDMTKISPDYLQANKDGDKVYFYSNWYSKDNKYSDYVTGEKAEYTFGDPVVTFSPGEENRYYIFQKPLPLYANAGGDTAGGMVEASGATWTLNGTSLGNPVTSINSDSWYYMVIEYYESDGNGGGRIVYQAVARKGSEFGSGIGGTDSGASAGAYLCWYDPVTGMYEPFVDDNGTLVEQPDGYVIAARPDGVRVGDMAQSIGTKGSGGNSTDTSDTYYLPTVSSSTTGGGSDDTIINIYLGNNGRLAVSDTQLLVTKTVNNPGAKDEVFKYTVKLENRSGIYNAIKVIRDGNDWRALIDTIELLTNNQGLLLNMDGSPATTEEGNYIYVGGDNAGDNFTHTLFDYKISGSLTDDDAITVTAYPVPQEDYDSDWSFDPSADLEEISLSVGTVDLNADIGFEFTSPYQSKTTYQTESLTFTNGEASFTLKDGEGLLFTGLDSGTDYTVTEIFTAPQVEAGFILQSVTHVQDSGKTTYPGNADPDSNTAKFDFNAHTYAISGSTSTTVVEAVHYVNTVNLASLEISKEIKGNPDIDDKFTFDVQLWDVAGGAETPLTGTYYAYVHKTSGHMITENQTERPCLPDDHDLTELEFENGKVTITLQANYTYVILGLPKGAKYTVTEIIGNMYSKTPEITVDNTQKFESDSVSGHLNSDPGDDGIIPAVHVTYVNMLLELPGTGGPGVWFYQLSGAALLISAAAHILLSGKRKSKNKSAII